MLTKEHGVLVMTKLSIEFSRKRVRQLGIAFVCFAGAGILFYFLPQEYQLTAVVGFLVVVASSRARATLGIGALLFVGFVHFVLYHVLRICGFNLVPTKFFDKRR